MTVLALPLLDYKKNWVNESKKPGRSMSNWVVERDFDSRNLSITLWSKTEKNTVRTAN